MKNTNFGIVITFCQDKIGQSHRYAYLSLQEKHIDAYFFYSWIGLDSYMIILCFIACMTKR